MLELEIRNLNTNVSSHLIKIRPKLWQAALEVLNTTGSDYEDLFNPNTCIEYVENQLLNRGITQKNISGIFKSEYDSQVNSLHPQASYNVKNLMTDNGQYGILLSSPQPLAQHEAKIAKMLIVPLSIFVALDNLGKQHSGMMGFKLDAWIIHKFFQLEFNFQDPLILCPEIARRPGYIVNLASYGDLNWAINTSYKGNPSSLQGHIHTGSVSTGIHNVTIKPNISFDPAKDLESLKERLKGEWKTEVESHVDAYGQRRCSKTLMPIESDGVGIEFTNIRDTIA